MKNFDNKKWTVTCLPALMLAVLLISPGQAQAEKPLRGTLRTLPPSAVSMGGAVGASSSGSGGIYLNPATLAMARTYSFEAMYQYTGEDEMHTPGAAVVDSVTSVVAAGLAFNYSRIKQSHSDHSALDGRLALAAGFGNIFYIGATGRYIRVENDYPASSWGPVGKASFPSSNVRNVDAFTFDAGAALSLANVLTIGVTGYNLTNLESVYAPLQLGTGLGVDIKEILHLETNLIVDFSSHEKVNEEVRAGAQVFIANQFAVRAGYSYDVYYSRNALCAGLGYVAPRFAIDMAFMREVVDEGRMELSFGVKIFIP